MKIKVGMVGAGVGLGLVLLGILFSPIHFQQKAVDFARSPIAEGEFLIPSPLNDKTLDAEGKGAAARFQHHRLEVSGSPE